MGAALNGRFSTVETAAIRVWMMSPAAGTPNVRARVLLVEDDVALSEALRFALRIEGYHVEVVERVEDLLARPVPDGPAVVIIDVNLPGMAAADALDAFRARGAATPVVLITTLPARSLRLRAERAGAVVLEKPILGDRLVRTVADMLSRGPGRDPA